jgi:hypothetical protein
MTGVIRDVMPLSTSELVNQSGETPMDLATTSTKRNNSEVCRALTLFDQM